MSALLAQLAPWTPWVLGALVLIALVVGLRVAYLVLSRTAPEDAETETAADGEGEAEDGEAMPALGAASPLSVRLGVRRAYREIRAYAPRATARYQDPWILMLGPEGAGTREVLEGVRLPRPLPELARHKPGFHVFDQGVVVDVPGAFVRRSDGTADLRSWESLLRSLVHHRPDRPVDGVVLAVPAGGLVGAGATAEGQRKLAEALFERLRQAQATLALRLPVHVLVTGMEEVPGFTDYAEQLPAPARAEIFGWSAPYSLDTAYQEPWTQEAFHDVCERVARSCVEILATREDVAEPSRLFRFPERLRQLEAPLGSLLASVFRESAYHSSFFLRGIGFSGSLGAADDAAGGSASHPLFVDELFQQKVFPERGLATAFRGSVLDRNRKIRALQIAALLVIAIGGPGMLWAHGRLVEGAAATEAILTTLHGDMAELQAMRSSGASMAAIQLEGQVFDLLGSMASVNVGRFGSVFLPTSWFSDVGEQVEATLESGFSGVILPVIRQGIVDWADTLSDATWARVKAATEVDAGEAELNPSTELPEHYALRRYLTEIVGYGPAAEQFNRIAGAGGGSVDEFADLVEWYFEQELPSGFRERSALYGRALEGASARPIGSAELASLQAASGDVAENLAQAVYDEFFRRVESVEAAVATFTSGAGSYGSDELRRLHADLEGVERFLRSSDPFWLDLAAPVDADVHALAAQIAETEGFSGEAFRGRFEADLRRIRDTRLAEVRQRLPSFGAVVAAAPAGDSAALPGLAPGLGELNASLRDLLGRPFMAAAPPRSQPIVPSFGARPTWDPAPLDEAVGLFEELQRFQASGLATFPAALQRPVEEASRRALEARVREAIYAAMTYEVAPDAAGRAEMERDLARRVASLDEAARRLVRMMELDESTGGFEISDVLAEVLALEVLDLLQAADRLLDAAPPYTLSGGTMGNWAAGRPASWAAFGVPDAAGLEARLGQQREALRSVAELVARPLGYTTLPPVDRLLRGGDALLGAGTAQRLARWRGILRTLDQYDAQTPANGLAALEGYVRTEMAARGPGECPREPVGAALAGADYFQTARERLERAFQQRCGELAREQVEVAYAELRAHFNGRLLNRFPFVSPEAAASAPDADPADVRAFLELYDRVVAPLGEDAPAVFATLPGGQEAAAFVRRVGDLRTLLSLVLAAGDPAAPKLGYRVEFRTDRASEQGADQIAEWALSVGGRRTTHGDPPDQRAGVWRPLEEVALTLRWASGSLLRPLAQPDPTVRVEGPAVTFTHGGAWSLLRLVAAHRPPGELPAADLLAEPGTLRFAVATAAAAVREAEARVGSGAESLAVAFVRLHLVDPSSGAAVASPPFPWFAPPLAAGGAGELRR